MADVNANIGVNIDSSQALAQLKVLQRQISEFHGSVAKTSEAAALAQKSLQKNLVNSVNSIGAFSAELRTVNSTAESFTKALENNKLSMREYFRYAAASTKTFGNNFKSELDTVGKVAEERVKTLQTQYIKLGRDANGAMKAIAVRPLELDMANLSTQTQLAAQKQAIFNQLMKQGSTNLLNFGKNTQWAGRQLMVGFTLPLAAFGSTAAKAFQQLETEVIKFRKVYGDLGTDSAQTEQALKNIRSLADGYTKYGVEVSKTVGLASQAAAAGFQGADLIAQTDAATKLSILGQIEQQQALDTTISLQNAFKISSTELATTIDFLNAVENQTVTSLDDITTAIPKVAPVIQSLGGDVKDLAFFLTAMKEGGVNAAEGANALKSGLASLINPTNKASELLGSMGINIENIVTKNKGNLKATVIEFAKALDTLDPLARARAIETMFGKFQFARISTLLSNVIQTGNQASRVLDLAGQSTSELASLTTKELGITAESALVKFQAAMAKLKASLAPVGEVFMKAFVPVVDFISKLIDKFNGLSDGTKKFVAITVGVIGGLGPVLLMTFGLLANGIANIIKLFLTLRAGFQRLTGQSKNLGEQTQYLTTEQLDAAAAAHSLEQSHARLTQQFTVEAGAVEQLRRAYQDALAAGASFAALNPGMMRAPKKFATGGIFKGPGTGTSDSIPAMVSNGEAIIPAKTVNKYPGMVAGLIAGNIPGFAGGLIPMFGEYAGRMQDPKQNMSQQAGITNLGNVLAPLVVRIAEGRGQSTSQKNILSGKIDQIATEFTGITQSFVDRVNLNYEQTYQGVSDTNERFKLSWMEAGKHVEKAVNEIASDADKGVLRKTFGLEEDIYSTIPTAPRKEGETTPTRARQGAFKKEKYGISSYTSLRPAFKSMYERITGTSGADLQYGHVGSARLTDIAKLEADPLASSGVRNAAKVMRGETSAAAAGKADGKAYTAAVKSSTTDVYEITRKRKSPHRLAPKDGKDDATAYSNAVEQEVTQRSRRFGIRNRGIAAGARPSGSILSGRGMLGGMGVMAGSMALAALPDFTGKAMVQSSMNLAAMGAAFGPWGAAAGAAVGLVTSGIGSLIAKQKEHAAVAQSTFGAAASAVKFFGDTALDTSLKINSVGVSITGVTNGLSTLNPEIKAFVEYVNSLPSDDPLKIFVDNLKNLEGRTSLIGTIRSKVASEIALGGLDPAKAKEYISGLLEAAGKSSQFAEVWKSVSPSITDAGLATETFIKKLYEAAPPITGYYAGMTGIIKSNEDLTVSQRALKNGLSGLVGAMTNGSLNAEQYKQRIEGIKKSSLDGKFGLDLLKSAIVATGDAGALTVFDGIIFSLDQIGKKSLTATIGLLAVQNAGLNDKQVAESLGKKYNANLPMDIQNKVSTANRLELAQSGKLSEILKKQLGTEETTSTTGTSTSLTGTGTDILSKEAKLTIARLQKELDGLKTKRDVIKDTNDELKRQYDYQQKLMSLQQDAVKAKLTGNYIGAAIIEQQKTQEMANFKKETDSLALDKRITSLENRISALQANARVTAAEKAVLKAKKKTYAAGGLIVGPGTGTSDSITARFNEGGLPQLSVSNGEYIVKAKSVENYGVGFMNAINNESLNVSNSSTGQGNTVYNIDMTINGGSANANEIAEQVMRKIKLVASQNNKTNKVMM